MGNLTICTDADLERRMTAEFDSWFALGQILEKQHYGTEDYFAAVEAHNEAWQRFITLAREGRAAGVIRDARSR
jgi:hypothetical protein